MRKGWLAVVTVESWDECKRDGTDGSIGLSSLFVILPAARPLSHILIRLSGLIRTHFRPVQSHF
jgi:hypothetical protein